MTTNVPKMTGGFSTSSGSHAPTILTRARTGLRARRGRRWASVAALVALLGVSLVSMRPVVAQVPPVTLEVLAAAFSPDNRIRLKTHGPSDILQTKIVVQPGGDTGWHTHPGPVIVVVKSGVVNEYHSNGCVSVHSAGSVFFEEEGEVHRVVNEGSVAGEAYATFLIPHGTQPLQPAATPVIRGCRPDRGDHRDHDRHDDRR